MSTKRILVCSGAGEPDYTTSKSFIRALKRTNHDIRTCGARYNNEIGEKADIEVEDMCFPETYSYKEILDKCKKINFEPEIILQIEPHFYLIGDKPDTIKSYYWVLDAHRAGYVQRNLAEYGNFDAIFISQPYFADAYFSITDKIFFLPLAYDAEKIQLYQNIEEECDIVFIGETGIADLNYDKYDSDFVQYTNKIHDDFLFSFEYSEYAERASLLYRLCKDFDVRIYTKSFSSNYSKIIQKSRIAFHRSLFKDITLRLFETLACKRALVCDYVPNIEQVLTNLEHCIFYKTYGYNVKLDNFELDYEQCKKAIEYLLYNKEIRNKIAENGYQHVKKYHTFDNRVEDFLRYIDNMQGK